VSRGERMRVFQGHEAIGEVPGSLVAMYINTYEIADAKQCKMFDTQGCVKQ
ncbi:hypothetical protein V1514DRAFT_322081, partial [Lipomyces japonicus]|uniref:uncharacterized protein n=1 Tax=Lipomyces japonicus TaxID=56871 RepID=UPI0034CE2F79